MLSPLRLFVEHLEVARVGLKGCTLGKGITMAMPPRKGVRFQPMLAPSAFTACEYTSLGALRDYDTESFLPRA